MLPPINHQGRPRYLPFGEILPIQKLLILSLHFDSIKNECHPENVLLPHFVGCWEQYTQSSN